MQERLSPEVKALFLSAVHHQNLFGWDMFLKGFTSSCWNDIQCIFAKDVATVQQWDTKLVACLLTLYRSLWDNRNTHIHGKTWQESKKKLRERVIEQVISLY
jgi:hypothetical protein